MAYFTVALIFVLCVANTYSSDSEDLSIESRIIGGSTASKKDFPYQASIRTRRNEHFCGGSIIGSRWILTSAKCVYGKRPNSLLTVVGSYKRKSKGQTYNVTRVITHEKYNQFNKTNDIALLYTSKDFQFGKYVKWISPASVNFPPDTKCELTGWGLKKYSSSGKLANKLRYLKEYTISYSSCKYALPQLSISTTNVCAFRRKGKGACSGDDGGPLMCKGQVYGVLSQYVPCAQGYPDVFTNVVSYRSWINRWTGML